MKFKDINNKVYDLDMGEVEGLTFLSERHPNLTPFTAITDAEAAALLAPTPDELEAKRVSDIKAEAQTRIINQLPAGEPENFIVKEMNLIMLNAELDNIVINGGVLTAEQQAQKNFFIALKDKIKDIRAMSQLARTNMDSLAAFQAALDVKGY